MKNYSNFEKLLIILANLILIGSLLLALSFAFNFYGFRDLFQDWDWIEKSFFFFYVIYAPIFPGMFYEWYEKFKYSRIKELYQEPSMSEKEAYLFHTPMVLSIPKKLLHLLRGNF